MEPAESASKDMFHQKIEEVLNTPLPNSYYTKTQGIWILVNQPVQDKLHSFCYSSLFFSYQGWLENDFRNTDSFCANKQLVVFCQVKYRL